MNKILAICAGILLILMIISHFRAEYWENKANNLEKQNKLLNSSLERIKNAEVETNKTITALRKSSQINKNNLDWYRMPIPNDVLVELQKRHNRYRNH